jgi:hypothetical protein
MKSACRPAAERQRLRFGFHPAAAARSSAITHWRRRAAKTSMQPADYNAHRAQALGYAHTATTY